jgi:hypothetical protein
MSDNQAPQPNAEDFIQDQKEKRKLLDRWPHYFPHEPIKDFDVSLLRFLTFYFSQTISNIFASKYFLRHFHYQNFNNIWNGRRKRITLKMLLLTLTIQTYTTAAIQILNNFWSMYMSTHKMLLNLLHLALTMFAYTSTASTTSELSFLGFSTLIRYFQ